MFHTKAAIAAAILAAAALPAAAQEVKLSLINFLQNEQAFGQPAVEWTEMVNKAGKGVVQIEIKPYGAIPVFEMGNAVKNGVADMGSVPATLMQNLLPIGDATKLATRSAAEIRKNGGFDHLNKLFREKVNSELLSMHGEGVPFNLYMRDKKIEKADLTGLKLRVTPIYRAFFRALGSQIVVIPPPEVLSALERGTVDGYGWPVWDIKTVGWDKYTKYMIEPGFYVVAGNIFINLPKWNSLSPQAKAILAKAGVDYDTKVWQQNIPAKEAKYKKERDDAGVQIVKLPAAEAAKYVKTAYDSGWAELEGLDAANAKILKPLFTK